MRCLSDTACTDEEQGYRRHFLRQDARSFAVLIGLGIVFNLLLIKADLIFLRLSPVFWYLLALRLGLVCLSAVTMAIILRTNDPIQFDRWCFIWSLVCALANTLVIFSRPASYTGHLIVDLFVVIALYAVQPGPTLRRVLPPLLLTLGSLGLFFAIKISIGFVATLSTVATYVAANIVGLSISTSWHRYRKMSFVASQRLNRLCREAEAGRLAAEASEQTWERIMDASPNMQFVIDRQYRIRRVNQAALGRLGLSREEAVGQRCYDVLCGCVTPPEHCLQQRILDDRQAHNVEARLASINADCRIMAAPLFDQYGNYEATVYIVQDISAQKQSERELLQAKEQYRSLVQNSHGIIFTISPDGIVRFVSPSFTRLLGNDPAVVIGKDFRSFIHPDDIAACEAFQKEIEITGVVKRNLEYRVFHQNGSIRWHVANFIPCFDENHQIVSFVGNAMDITALKQYQEELDGARQTAESSSRVKSEFLALISHEIRTPLNALVGFSSLARKADDPVVVQQYLDILDQSSRLLMDLVNDILDLSKIEAGRLSLEMSAFNLADTLEVIVWQNAPLAAQKALGFDVVKGEGVPGWIKGDPMRFRQILSNLIANALKFTESGRVTLTVSTKESAAHGFLVRFEVRDTGIGIANDKQALLFQPFRQLDPSISRRYGGTGLGLAIVQRLVTLMKGRIEVVSEEGRGSCFTVELPFLASSPPNYKKITPGNSIPLDILVVEDNAFNRRLLRDTLSAWNHQVTVAENALQALELTEQFCYHLVILDVRMPDVDGIRLTHRIRQRELERNVAPVPIIAYTADTDEMTKAQCLAAGMMAVLFKPLDPAQLAQTMREHGPQAVSVDASNGKVAGAKIPLADQVVVDMGHDPTQLQTYLRLLWDDIQHELDRMARAMATEDRSMLKAAAHSLKGLCGNLQDKLPGALAHQLQDGAIALPFSELRQTANRLRSMCTRFTS